MQERIDVREGEIKKLENGFNEDVTTKANTLKEKIGEKLNSENKLNDLKIERVKVEGLEKDIKWLDKKIDK